MANKIMICENYEVRVMAESEGWAMVRRKGCMPVVVRSSILRQPTPRAVDGLTGLAFKGVRLVRPPLTQNVSGLKKGKGNEPK